MRPVARDSIRTDPVQLSVGSIATQSSVLAFIELSVVGTVVITSSPKAHRKSLFASGFLYGYTNGLPLAECGRLGSVAAAEVISHVGARPLVELKRLA